MAIIKRADKRTEFTKKREYYSDFTNNISITAVGDAVALVNEDSVTQSLHNLIMTNPFERLHNPRFGCGIRDLLFENITPQTESMLRDKIEVAINNFEPRVKLLEVVTQGTPDNNAYLISITFSVINKQEPITVEFVLDRIR